jgi:D-beta-D-heptose 7-phosphate kinase/D-beta-D-heptose 1-phosphate adenosyltransferase
MKKVLVVGDLMLDEYIWGEVSRMSPEAPVPVVFERGRSNLLGGAGNVLNNMAGLGYEVLFCGIVGYDDTAGKVYKQFKQKGYSAAGLIEDTRPTTVKTRVMGNGQQIVRVDNEHTENVYGATLNNLLSSIKAFGRQADAIIISDYAKGVVTRELMEEIKHVAKDKLIVGDPKPLNARHFNGITCMTPNRKEASEISGFTVENRAEAAEVGKFILDVLKVDHVLITLGGEGMVLVNDGTHFINTEAKQVYDVSGAGDTVISTFTHGLLSGLTPIDSAVLANKAAGIIVGERGTTFITKDKLYG